MAPDGSIKIVPSILSADFSRLAEETSHLERAGADWIHLDVMDGHFVPNITFGPQLVASVRNATGLPLDVHLMIEHPERYLEAFVGAGADLVSVHVEACPHLHRTVQAIRSLGARPGVVLNPSTPLSTLEHILEDVDLVLLMTVNPGFGGQAFISAMIPKVAGCEWSWRWTVGSPWRTFRMWPRQGPRPSSQDPASWETRITPRSSPG